MTMNHISLAFHGGAGTVTGANFLVTTKINGQTSRLLVDCGLFQGSRIAEASNLEPFAYQPAEVEALLVTHAHLDHIGRIPRLVHQGFAGTIYSTAPTKEIAELSLIDSLGVLEKESRQHKTPLPYEEADVHRALGRWQTLDYEEEKKIGPWAVTVKNAGHILGSAMYVLKLGERSLLFTGDLGDKPVTLPGQDEQKVSAEYIVMESVYGDREHESPEGRVGKLEDVIEETVHRGGVLLIPAFSIERTQEVLGEIEAMMEAGRIPPVPVFLDSPLAIHVTEIYKKYAKIKGLFHFPNLRLSLTTEESKAIAGVGGPKIIIAGSGMSNGGRILHHEKRYLPDSRTTLLIVGHQAVASLGRLLQDGAETVTIMGETVPVRAKVVTLSGYSAHRDVLGLMDFVRHCGDKTKRVYVTMGEPEASFHLAQKIRDYLGLEAVVPSAHDEVFIS